MLGPGSRPPSRGTVETQLRHWSEQLHDLSGRNRLLYYHDTKASSAAIEQPTFAALFRLLVERGKVLSAPLPRLSDRIEERVREAPHAGTNLEDIQELLPETPDDATGSEVPAAVVSGAEDLGGKDGEARRGSAIPAASSSGRARKQNEIVTNHSVAQLNRVLYNLRYAARTVLEEQGLNVLYVTFGMLRWKENHSPTFSRAPLVLVPVRLEREHPNSPYSIRAADEDIVVNPVLQVKLEKEFGLELPELGGDPSLANLRRFLQATTDITQDIEGWRVEEQATLGAFSFLTLLLIKDFEAYAPLYAVHPLIRWLSGQAPDEPTIPLQVPQAVELDETVDPSSVYQVLDADSSQQEAIEAAKRGLSFVLQGPPGTGKSQTITNLIAESIVAGRRVLFISQKLAALEVVKRRLERRGLGEFCLEIHSHRMDKRKVVSELMTSLNSSSMRISHPEIAARQREIREVRTQLNEYVHEIHEPRPALGLSLFELHGRLSEALDAPHLEVSLPDVVATTAAQLTNMRRIVGEISSYEDVILNYAEHPWRGFADEGTSIEQRERIAATFTAAAASIGELHASIEGSLKLAGLEAPRTLQQGLEFAHVLTCFRPEILLPSHEGMIQRYKGRGLSQGRFLSIQYGSDAERLQTLLRTDVEVTTRDISAAMATLKAAIERGRGQSPAGDMKGLPFSDDASQLRLQLRAIEAGYAEARALFAPDDSPEILRELYGQPAEALAGWFREHAEQVRSLQDLAHFNAVVRTAADAGLGDFVRMAIRSGIAPSAFGAAFSRRFYELLIERIVTRLPRILRFRGSAHLELIRRFQQLDQAMIDRSANEIRARLYAKKPEQSWMNAASAETSILRREFNKKRRIKPLRKLFAETPRLLQALKPCLMMSPLTVCQLLDPNLHEFDLAVFDEASQIPPEYAVGAFLRARQVIIAGDRQQLPPTNFFQTVEGEEPGEEAGPEDGEFESILTLCDSRGFPSKMLNWHYRSRDESLIAYSNHHFYEDRLLTFPSARFGNAATGLKYVFVEDGIYEPGDAARHNLREAAQVAQLAVEHLVARPDLSLGIVAFSAPQRRAIESAIDRLRVRYQELNVHFDAKAGEPVFIKNLENVQGDERDVIILSVGYGKDKEGKFSLNFGPLNRDGGPRRLNVAVTRARFLLYLVASIQPEDIDLGRAGSQGAALLRDYLATARDGVRALVEATEEGDGEPTSLFEDAVYNELVARGLDVARRVGASQYRIDLAIRHPDAPNRFLLGVECDGAMYRSAQTARDRDRLRQQVLEGLGWRVHRIWSRDWIRDKDAEIKKILDLVERLSDEPEPSLTPSSAPTANAAQARRRWRARQDAEAEREEAVRPLPAHALPFKTGRTLDAPGGGKQALLAASRAEIIDGLQRLANNEGPIAVHVAKSAVARAWNARNDGEVSNRIEAAVRSGQAQGAFRLNGDFIWPVGLRGAPLRIHAAGQPKRKIDEIAPEEIDAGLRECVRAAVSLSRHDLIRESAKLFGLKATGAIEDFIDQRVHGLIDEDVLAEIGGKIGRGARFDQRPPQRRRWIPLAKRKQSRAKPRSFCLDH